MNIPPGLILRFPSILLIERFVDRPSFRREIELANYQEKVHQFCKDVFEILPSYFNIHDAHLIDLDFVQTYLRDFETLNQNLERVGSTYYNDIGDIPQDTSTWWEDPTYKYFN